MRFVLAFAIACGPRAASTPTDFGPPPAPVDPIVCPAARLERFAEATEMTLEISTEPVVDTNRVDQVPCKPDETDAQCLARARKRPAPPSYEVVGVTLGSEDSDVEFVYEIDGRRVVEQAASLAKMVERLKALQAGGHKVSLLRGESLGDTSVRHAAVAYRGVGVQERRVGTLRWRPTRQDTDIPAARARAIERIQAVVAEQRLELRALDTANEIVVVTATCGPS